MAARDLQGEYARLNSQRRFTANSLTFSEAFSRKRLKLGSRGGGMADAEDLKSSDSKGRAGSCPALGITIIRVAAVLYQEHLGCRLRSLGQWY